jgi:hypothetical protein
MIERKLTSLFAALLGGVILLTVPMQAAGQSCPCWTDEALRAIIDDERTVQCSLEDWSAGEGNERTDHVLSGGRNGLAEHAGTSVNSCWYSGPGGPDHGIDGLSRNVIEACNTSIQAEATRRGLTCRHR